MKVKVICTFPEYSGIFLNTMSKNILLNRDPSNPLRPKYPKKYGHHVTLQFAPGQAINMRFASKVDLAVVKHIYDSVCQLIVVEPVSVTYRSLDSDAVTITDPDEIVESLGGVDNVPSTPMYITISTVYDNNGEKINHEYSEELLQRYSAGDPDVVCEEFDEPLTLYGFCAMRCEAIVERGAIRKIERDLNRRSGPRDNRPRDTRLRE